MPITREQPDHVFKTSDGRLFSDAEEAHCHERYIQVKDAVLKYCHEKKVLSTTAEALVAHFYNMAPKLSLICRATPLANA